MGKNKNKNKSRENANNGDSNIKHYQNRKTEEEGKASVLEPQESSQTFNAKLLWTFSCVLHIAWIFFTCLAMVLYGLWVLILIIISIFSHNPFIFNTKKRSNKNSRPSCMESENLGKHDYHMLKSGTKLHYVSKSFGDEDQKPLLLFLHGFPACWYSWRHQMKAFSSRFRCVAVDLKGYGESSRPGDIRQYTMKIIVEELKELVDHLNSVNGKQNKVILVGHNWGGYIAFKFSMQHRDMVEKLIIFGAAHPAVYEDCWKSWTLKFRPIVENFLIFQIPILSEILITVDDWQFLEDVLGFKDCSEVVEAYKYYFGYDDNHSGPLNYYRSIFRSISIFPPKEKDNQKLSMPTLLFIGSDDPYLSQEDAAKSKEYVGPDDLEMIEGDHWVHEKKSEEVNTKILNWLEVKTVHPENPVSKSRDFDNKIEICPEKGETNNVVKGNLNLEANGSITDEQNMDSITSRSVVSGNVDKHDFPRMQEAEAFYKESPKSEGYNDNINRSIQENDETKNLEKLNEANGRFTDEQRIDPKDPGFEASNDDNRNVQRLGNDEIKKQKPSFKASGSATDETKLDQKSLQSEVRHDDNINGNKQEHDNTNSVGKEKLNSESCKSITEEPRMDPTSPESEASKDGITNVEKLQDDETNHLRKQNLKVEASGSIAVKPERDTVTSNPEVGLSGDKIGMPGIQTRSRTQSNRNNPDSGKERKTD